MDEITTERIERYIEECFITLKCTERNISIPIVNRFYKKMKGGIRFPNISVCEDLIIDGHHRYLASLLAGVAIGKNPSLKSSATKVVAWTDVSFIESDYYTDAEIVMLHKQDAEFINVSLEDILRLLE